MVEDGWSPEWCIVGNLLPYPYSANGPRADFRSQKIFPAGAKLYVVGGFGGLGYETITVIGYAHGRRRPVTAHIKAKYVGNWRAELVYRPVILRAIHAAENEQDTYHRWLTPFRDERTAEYHPSEPAYGEHLAEVAAYFQRKLHGGR
ncbi:hypothetical protein GA0070609_5659 [Micromonospora echinaurantiaca]|uniref:Uncharacterized protein n=1 Tax=Micromonospora echinaurantiaca TaxID=47857 RepID=A0A1C5K7D7_9ACTN|nr:hypothetical protein [Micromonospora echinaurantiaca]SCG78692.1 hypothetical protein GA0070609_5659 [Micromonospora echinaurantiaca]